MQLKSLYVYGIVKFGFDLEWNEPGLNGKNVYIISEGEFSALVHDCEEKPYLPKDPEKIKELIIAHNDVLARSMKAFGGVIPMHFNTIIKKGENSSQYNLKAWLSNDEARLERIWNKIKGKKEYGIRIYYEKDKLIKEASDSNEIKKIEHNLQGKSQGLTYLLDGKAKSMINEIAHNKTVQFKQKFYGDIKKTTGDVMINTSRIFIDEEKDLLMSLSVLVDKQQINKIKRILEESEKDFSFRLAGPFPAYSFVENAKKP